MLISSDNQVVVFSFFGINIKTKIFYCSFKISYYSSPCTPIGYSLQAIHGFVEELIVNDDPEYQWIDKIRTPRASNEARQVAFLKLSGQVQRKIGLKAIEMGANTVIAYKLSFDLENDIGVVARGSN